MTDQTRHTATAADISTDLWDCVEAIQASGSKICFVITGGGSLALSWMLNHPGASRSVLDIQVPYCSSALDAYLVKGGPHAVTVETARLMAQRAYESSLELHPEGIHQIGVSCTAALATNRERRGEDRAWIAFRSTDSYRFQGLRFESGTVRDDVSARLEQEEILSRQVISALAAACGLQAPDFRLPDQVTLIERESTVETTLEDLYTGVVDVVEMRMEGDLSTTVDRNGRLLLSGSFDPLHEGHIELAAAAERSAGRPASLEISINNVDKPTIPYTELMGRLEPLRGRFPVLLTRAATFDQKAALFADACFVIGYDTAVRLFEPAYYSRGESAGSERDLDRALDLLKEQGSRFLVAGRTDDDGQFKTLADIDVSTRHGHLLEAIPESEFRRDLSSSQVREQERGGQ